jgi:hypothetical protein
LAEGGFEQLGIGLSSNIESTSNIARHLFLRIYTAISQGSSVVNIFFTMADTGNAILNHYKIDTLFPAEWPASKDGEESSDDEGLLPAPKPQRVISKSRYSVLEPKRSSVPGAERTKDGLENLVQRDEPDPL